jgi:hypothetical protein
MKGVLDSGGKNGVAILKGRKRKGRRCRYWVTNAGCYWFLQPFFYKTKKEEQKEL